MQKREKILLSFAIAVIAFVIMFMIEAITSYFYTNNEILEEYSSVDYEQIILKQAKILKDYSEQNYNKNYYSLALTLVATQYDADNINAIDDLESYLYSTAELLKIEIEQNYNKDDSFYYELAKKIVYDDYNFKKEQALDENFSDLYEALDISYIIDIIILAIIIYLIITIKYTNLKQYIFQILKAGAIILLLNIIKTVYSDVLMAWFNNISTFKEYWYIKCWNENYVSYLLDLFIYSPLYNFIPFIIINLLINIKNIIKSIKNNTNQI